MTVSSANAVNAAGMPISSVRASNSTTILYFIV